MEDNKRKELEAMEEHLKIIHAKLKAPFPADKIHWRIGATNQDKTQGIPLAYVDARDVMQRLDEVVGPFNWQSDYPWSDDKRLVCRLGININGEWLWKSNGAGDTNVEAEKGAFSDAFKRAGVLWGIAQYLYDLPTVWIPLENKKISKEELKKLTERLEKWQTKYFDKGEQDEKDL